MKDIKRIKLLGVSVDAVDFDDALERAASLAADRSKTSRVVAVNPEKVMIARQDPLIARFIEDSDLAIPDGIGCVMGARILYGLRFGRVPGCDLMQKLCEISGSRGLKIFIYGAKEEVNKGAVEKLRETYPDISIVGRQNGYLKENEYDALVDRVNASGANILFLALGSPKQEKWVEKYGDKLNVGLCMGIGGTLDTIVGTVKRAPLAWRNAKLEWLYRLLKQPSRFGRQSRVFVFAFRVLAAKLTGRRRKNAENSEDSVKTAEGSAP